MSNHSSAGMDVLGIAVPKALLGVTRVRKSQQGEAWALTTKRGITLGTFASEAELDFWWLFFLESRVGCPPFFGPPQMGDRSGDLNTNTCFHLCITSATLLVTGRAELFRRRVAQ